MLKSKIIFTALPIVMLALMGFLMFSGIKDDAIIIDEDPHIGAGYSYLKKGDFRLNPEHPPLMKDLGALPLLRMKLTEPWEHKSWVSDINGQWEFGRALIFGGGNNADIITQAAKKPMIAFTLLFGLVLFLWTRKNFGNTVAMLATFFYTFSPTFLAHGRFVTTDVGAAAGFFVATVLFLRFLKNPTSGNVLWAGLGLGFAFLAKFSTFMLLPIFFIVLAVWIFAHRKPAEAQEAPHPHLPFIARGIAHQEEHIAQQARYLYAFWPMLWKFIWVVLAAYIAIYPLYWHHTRNYPLERQKADTEHILASYSVGVMRKAASFMEKRDLYPQYQNLVREFPKNLVVWGSDKLLFKPYAEYFLGLLMVFQRSAGGNTAYFFGEISKYGSTWYFPVVYALKEPFALHLLTFAVLLFGITRIRRPMRRREWLQTHITEIAFAVGIAFYWWASMRSILNIGIRHVLPTFPFIYILVALGVVSLYRCLLNKKLLIWGFRLVLVSLMLWQASSVLRVHPFYLAYFNEAAGGPEGGAQYVVDSNLDWGQDIKRLAQFVDARGIDEIWVDYFGWADPAYYLGNKRKWLSSCDEPKKGWVAVSASFYQGSHEKPACDYRRWLPLEKRVASIGYSIYVFHNE